MSTLPVPEGSSPGMPSGAHEQPDEGYQFNRATLLPTKSEDTALVHAREVGNWCKRCNDFKMPVFSDENAAGICVGIAAGLAGAWWAGDFTKHPDRAFALQLGIAVFGFLFVLFAAKAYSQRKKTEHDLAKLSSEMEGACKAGLARAAAEKAEADQKAESTGGKKAPLPQAV